MKNLTAIILGLLLSIGTMSAMAQTSGGKQKKTKKPGKENTIRDTSGSSAADTSGSKTQPGGKREQPVTGSADSAGKQPQR